jgi:hypothetical protein
MAYVYRHIRLDKNVPFYIGIGSDTGGRYDRAYEKGNKKRSLLWCRITAKTSYEVQIIIDDLSWEDANKKEIEFIKLYGRIKDKTGSLVNITDGGGGYLGYKPTKEIVDNFLLRVRKPIKLYSSDGKFIRIYKSSRAASNDLKISFKLISDILKNKYVLHNGFHFEYDDGVYNDINIKELYKDDTGKNSYLYGRRGSECYNYGNRGIKNHKSSPVVQMYLDGSIKCFFGSTAEAGRSTGFDYGNIAKCCRGELKKSKGFKWKYITRGDYAKII